MKYVTALLSALVWGSGHVVNKQKIKGLSFFLFQVILVVIELGTGSINILNGSAEPQFRNAGFFIRGLWGLITLGTIPRTNSSVRIYDHSIMLMLAGIISTLALLIFAAIWIWNIVDAYKTRRKIEEGVRISSADYFSKLWKESFEYIMITPGMLLIIFISIVPIVFAILVAFTNYNANFIPPRRLVEWRGFETFVNIIGIKIWGSTFVQIFIWTVIWAFLATFT